MRIAGQRRGQRVTVEELEVLERRRELTDRALKAMRPAPVGSRYEVMDTQVPHLGVRVTDTGHRSFIFVARFPGSRNPTRRMIGEFVPVDEQTEKRRYMALSKEERGKETFEGYLVRAYGTATLAGAREKARKWDAKIKSGIDPREEEERQRAELAQKRHSSFATVVEDFVSKKLPGERKGKEVERDIRRDLIPAWGRLPITEITTRQVRDLIKAKKMSAPAQARNLLGIAKRLFTWAVNEDSYGLSASPIDVLKPNIVVGEKRSGRRILDDRELFALWRAVGRTPYPHGPVYKVLILTALRLNEAADASRPEIDLPNRLWTIPADRMKGKNGKARPHVVPVTDDLLAVLQGLPSFKDNYLFSTNFGKSPVWITDKVKKRIDRRMLRTLRALARRNGEDPAKIQLPRWTNHDIRRTVRSGLSRLRVSEEAREAVMAHARPGIKDTYDLYDYLDEKREALDLWAARVRAIVKPPPSNVVSIAQARG